MAKDYQTSKFYQTLRHIARSARHLSVGNLSDAQTHLEAAHASAGLHLKDLTMNDRHDEAAAFSKRVTPYFEKLDSIIKSKSSIKKSFGAGVPMSSASAARKEFNATGSLSPMKVNRNPGQDPRYGYKAFHELSRKDQERATHAFGGKDMESHFYPTDKNSGEFVHGTRWKQPGTAPKANNQGPAMNIPSPQAGSLQSAPKATEHFPPVSTSSASGVVPPEQMPGSGVRIHSPGTQNHERLGIVQRPNPNMPGKVPIQIRGKERFETVFVEPHEVRLSRPGSPVTKSESDLAPETAFPGNIIILKKAREAIARIRNGKRGSA